MQELDVRFQDREVLFAVVRSCPKHIVVVGEGGEEDAEEETRCWRAVSRARRAVGWAGELYAR
jgi:hypothetical protein